MKFTFYLLPFVLLSPACSRSSAPEIALPPEADLPALPAVASVEQPPQAAPKPSTLLVFRSPTGQPRLDGSITTNVFMHTGTGRPESGMYGDIRTGSDGRARYHGGIDIAPLKYGRGGAALDTVHAIADGRVAYVNRSPGSSNYGNYVVLLHNDPSFGDMFSLYAHLASVAPGLAAGQEVSIGHNLGVVGNTGAEIPRARAHLHLETGLVLSTRYADFASAKKLTNPHGNWNGRTLQGFNPCDLYARLDSQGRFDLSAYMQSLPTAFRAAVRVTKPVGYFTRYPALWQGAPLATANLPEWVVMDFSAEGLPVFARVAAASERPAANANQVLFVDEKVLGRNGRRLVVRGKNGWTLSQAGTDLITLLLL